MYNYLILLTTLKYKLAQIIKEFSSVTLFHIRRPMRRPKFYRETRSARSQGTVCGAPDTVWDIKPFWLKSKSFGSKYDEGFILCPECKQIIEMEKNIVNKTNHPSNKKQKGLSNRA